MCIYEICRHIFLSIPDFISNFAVENKRIVYDSEANFDIEL